MSRPEAHPLEYDPYRARSQGENGRMNGRENGHGHGHGSRDFGRDSRAVLGQLYTTVGESYMNRMQAPSPATVAPPERRLVTSTSFVGSGYSSFVAPRIAQGTPAGTDPWSSKPASYPGPPNVPRPPAEGPVPPPQKPQDSQLQHPIPTLFPNHHRHQSSPSPPRAPPTAELYNTTLYSPLHDRDTRDTRDILLSQFQRQHQPPPPPQQQPQQQQPPPQQLQSNIAAQFAPQATAANITSRSTLWWGELEPWMDEEYAKQVCNLMGWDPVSIKVPRPAPDPVTGQQANNPGYCFLTFPSQAHAASVLSQINNSNNGGSASLTMPNSSKPFSLNWASSVPATPLSAVPPGQAIPVFAAQNPQFPKEYSIFVGDLAPEVSNSDLVAVFRNPVLGLRNDREPRFIRPFLSCKSAKIMLDPVTGVSRGYGFVRFTDEADQQRALIEMHGLYCLSRPMRISPATAKFKPVPGMGGMDMTQMQFPVVPTASAVPEQPNPVTITLPIPHATQTKSVSAPLAGSTTVPSGSSSSISSTAVSNSTSSSSVSAPSLSSTSTVSSTSTLASAASDESLKAQIAAATAGPQSVTNGNGPSVSAPFAQPTQDQLMAQKYNISEESWKHHAQARAILSNLIGPNGEQLTSSDPYNTTVFVGGLSPLISEETLRTFFAPFGDIHYVKVPVGKHCGFVQFVRKPDAERAIEKMQGFPIGGSRIRLSWGRSQYKAAQAAAQAAQAAAFQAQYPTQSPPVAPATQPAPSSLPSLTPEQALQLLEKFGFMNLINGGTTSGNGSGSDSHVAAALVNDVDGDRMPAYNAFQPPIFGPRPTVGAPGTNFSPFSPDPNYLAEGMKEQQSSGSSVPNFRQPAKPFAPWYNVGQDEKATTTGGKISPPSAQAIRPSSAAQRSWLSDGSSAATSAFQVGRATARQDGPIPIARPEPARKNSQTQDQFPVVEHEHEHDIQDLNGTLASLDLDHQGMWKSRVEGQHTPLTSQ